MNLQRNPPSTLPAAEPLKGAFFSLICPKERLFLIGSPTMSVPFSLASCEVGVAYFQTVRPRTAYF